MKPCAREGCTNTVTSTHPKARWCSNACKQAGWKERTGYEVVGVRKASQRRRNAPSGAQVAYVKAVEAVALDYQRAFGLSAFEAVGKAVMVLFPALSAKQQAMLTRREMARLDGNR